LHALDEPAAGDVRPHHPASSWNFDTMGAHSKTSNARPAGPERDLVEDIARAMQNRPLMRRLASLEADYGGGARAPAAPELPPPAAPAFDAAALSQFEEDPLAAIQRRVEEADVGWAMPPASAEWLGKAQRERNRARLRNAIAWMATLAIGGAIIATTALMLKP
jgi:hypothetical protein